MTNGEAIREIQERINTCEKWYLDEVSEYYDALTMAIAALEKQEPVRPTDIRNYGDKDKVGFCPVCRVGANSYMKYCEECGQRLNWTEDAE